MNEFSVRPKLLMLTGVALALAALHHQAHAEAHTSVVLDNYQYTLTDLAPDDGVAPSVTWGKGVLTQSLGATTSSGVAPGGGPNVTGQNYVKKSYEVPIGTSKSLTYQGFDVSSDAASLKTSVNIPVGGTWGEVNQYDQEFVLGPHTAITFTAAAKVLDSVTVPPDSVVTRPGGYQDNGYFDWAPIQATSAAVLAFDADVSSMVQASPPCWSVVKCDYVVNSLRSYKSTSQGDDKLLSLTLTNDSTSTLSSRLSAAAYSNGYATAPLVMVPELSMPAMMLTGLAGIVVLGRRRRTVAVNLA